MYDDGYLEIRKYRDNHIIPVSHSHFKLNHLHDEIICRVIHFSIIKVEENFGPPPCPFCFFVMGSAGRFEQSIWSDQDHGIIYHEEGDETNAYFLALGKEISRGLQQCGYDYCDGGVMANNPLWCKSLSEWEQQLVRWTVDSSWESIRQLLIFIDGRSLYGNSAYLQQLKTNIYLTIKNENLLKRVLNNTTYLKKGVGVLGQILIETHGPHSGSLNIKEKALFPYVNAIPILAIKEKILKTSTLSRLEQIPDSLLPPFKKEFYKQQFLTLLDYRLLFATSTNYENGHYLRIDNLSKKQREEVKVILKSGYTLNQFVRNTVEKEE